MGKNITWEKVSFATAEKASPACVLTFRPNAQIVFGVDTLEALQYPRYVHLFHSPSNNLIAIKATGKADGDALQLTAKDLPKNEPRTISATKVYAWICGLLQQNPGEVLIKLTGAANEEGMIVFDLKAASIAPKRVLKTTGPKAE